MAISDVAICNLALDRLGADRIASLVEDTVEARACNAAYTHIRDAELRRRAWGFATKRVVLAPDTETPAFDYNYQFTKPSDCLRILPPNTRALDWRFEGNKILTNDGNTLNLRYIARIEDPAKFDSLFVDALAARLAWHMAEVLTQSNSKKDAALRDYRLLISEARQINAFEQISDEPPIDEWVAAREIGSWNGGAG